MKNRVENPDATPTELYAVIRDLDASNERLREMLERNNRITYEQAETIERQAGEIARLNAGLRPNSLADLMKAQKLCVTLEFELR